MVSVCFILCVFFFVFCSGLMNKFLLILNTNFISDSSFESNTPPNLEEELRILYGTAMGVNRLPVASTPIKTEHGNQANGQQIKVETATNVVKDEPADLLSAMMKQIKF